MKKILFFLSLLLATYSISYSQGWQSFVTLPGSGTTSMKMNANRDLFFTTASFNYPSGQSAGVYGIFNGSFITIPINPISGMAYNARTVETEGNNAVWVSYWGNPSTQSEALYYSSNRGNTWTNRYSIGTNNNIFSILADTENENVLFGARNGVYKSTDNGVNFGLSNIGMATNSWTYDIKKVQNEYFAATSNGIYRSSNYGSLWLKVTGIPQQDTPKTIAVVPSMNTDKIYVGTQEGNLYFTDDLANPTLQNVCGFDNAFIIAMLFLQSPQDNFEHFIISAFNKYSDNPGPGLYYSFNNTVNWTNFGAGLPVPYTVSALGGKMEGNVIKIFAGTYGNTMNGVGIFEKEYTVGINNLSSAVPEKYSLSQNYPNPFNPSTKIRFEIQKSSDTKLVVYNSLGKEISTLVNERLNAGTYETDFNGAGYNSGVYFYKLFINGENSFNETRKMILTK